MEGAISRHRRTGEDDQQKARLDRLAAWKSQQQQAEPAIPPPKPPNEGHANGAKASESAWYVPSYRVFICHEGRTRAPTSTDEECRMPWEEEPAELEKARPGPGQAVASAREAGDAVKAAVVQVRAPHKSCGAHV